MNKKKILIIGGTGFIGQHLTKNCKKKKWLVMDIVLLIMALGTASDLFLLRKMDINLLEYWGTGKPPAEEVDIMDKLEDYQKRKIIATIFNINYLIKSTSNYK